MPWCKDCGQYILSDDYRDYHTCPPIFEVHRVDSHDKDEWSKIRAHDEKDATEKYAEREDVESADYGIVGGDVAEIWVRVPGGANIKKFSVCGETVPHYHATAINE